MSLKLKQLNLYIKGLDIISLRLKKVNKNLEDLDKVLKNIEKKTEFTEELDNSGEEPKIEIKEVISTINFSLSFLFKRRILYNFFNKLKIASSNIAKTVFS